MTTKTKKGNHQSVGYDEIVAAKAYLIENGANRRQVQDALIQTTLLFNKMKAERRGGVVNA